MELKNVAEVKKSGLAMLDKFLDGQKIEILKQKNQAQGYLIALNDIKAVLAEALKTIDLEFQAEEIRKQKRDTILEETRKKRTKKNKKSIAN